MNLKDTYNLIAKDWHEDHLANPWWQSGMDQFLQLLPHGSSILDAGCGSGLISRYMVDHGMGVTGIDFSENMIALAQQYVPEARFTVMDIYNLDSLSEQFDGILLHAVLLHIPHRDIPAVLAQIAGHLRPGGYMYISVKAKRDDGPATEIRRQTQYGREYERYWSYFTTEELVHSLQQSGLTVVKSNTPHVETTSWIEIIAQK